MCPCKWGEGDLHLVLTVDDEGVVRVLECDDEVLEITPDELARLLTALLTALVVDGGEKPLDLDL